MIDTLQDNNINDICNLIFFTEKGYEIPVDKTYVIQWEIIPNEQISGNFISNPKGHFIYDLPETSTDEIKIQSIIDEAGKIIICDTSIICNNSFYKDENGNIDFNPNDSIKNITSDNIYTYCNDITLLDINHIYGKVIKKGYNRYTGKYESDIEDTSQYINNTVKITFNTLTETVEREYPAKMIFDSIEYKTVTVTKQVDDEEEDDFTYFYLKNITLSKIEDLTSEYKKEFRGDTLIHVLINNNFTYDQLFPCVRYIGSIQQDKVSTDFVDANTFIVLEKVSNKNTGDVTFERPKFGESNRYNLRFEFQNDSEMQFISSATINDIIWSDHYEVSVDYQEDNAFNKGLEQNDKYTPIHFTVGFQTEIEGCYQNIMAMYLSYKNPPEDCKRPKFLVGLFTFLTEVEGEDERYRALLGNLGIPDPIKYPNIFKSQDPDEQGVDWTLINSKSKELMLTYENIFPYVGTYKALLGAVKFLGYQDLIFKEWYKIKDQNGNNRLVTLQTYDLTTGTALKTKLKQIGVNYGDFERYKKLNKLTMVYHLNELDDETGETISFWTRKLDTGNNATTAPESGLYKAINPNTHNDKIYDTSILRTDQFIQLPITYKIYEYRTDEVLAKLYSVKQWIEKYILGVNCYITDICGEGIIVERLKNQAYMTQHHLQDITVAGKFTPKICRKTEFIDSSAQLVCSLNEFDSLSFEDYVDYSIDRFIKYETNINGKHIYVSNPIETLVTADEYQFSVYNNEVESGTLVEFTDTSYIKNPMLIQDNEILFFDDTNNTTIIDPEELPIIEISSGNLRYPYGEWKSNIAYSIMSAYDQKSGEEYYIMSNDSDSYGTDYFYKGKKKITLYPYKANDKVNKYKLYWTYGEESEYGNNSYTNYDGVPSALIYTADTKWGVPMLICRNFICSNNNEMLMGDFILEIHQGRMLFRNKNSDLNTSSGKAFGAEVNFNTESESNEQQIFVDYTYRTERTPIYTFDIDKLKNKTNISEDDLVKCVSTYRDVSINVNRLGNYSISVNAFDSFNNIFVNNSDDIITLSAKPIEIDTIINSKSCKNSTDFYEENTYGDKLSENEVKELLQDISINSSIPIQPQNYRIYDIDPMLDTSNMIEYNNISYAIDTPRDGNFIVFNNFTEKVLNIEAQSEGIYKLKLLDENPNSFSLKLANDIGLCIYDNQQRSIVSDIYPLQIIDRKLDDLSTEKKYYTYNNAYIKVCEYEDTISGSDAGDLSTNLHELSLRCTENTSIYDSSTYFTNRYSAYVYNATEYVISSDNESTLELSEDMTTLYRLYSGKSNKILILVDYNTQTSKFYSEGTQYFYKDQVVKVCFTNDASIHNQYTNNSIDNETSYRIISVKNLYSSGDIIEPTNNLTDTYEYTVDGIIDLQKLNNKLYHSQSEYIMENNYIGPLKVSNTYKIKVCPVSLRATQYILRISGFGEEVISRYNNSNIMKTQVQYEPTPLFFNNYIDTVYSAQIFDYDPKLFQNIWYNVNTIFNENTDLYRYRDKPITINKNRALILMPNKDQKVFANYIKSGEQESYKNEVPIKVNWYWKSYLIDDLSNFHNTFEIIDKQIIFKSINKILTVKPELLGAQSPNMVCCDIYGNRLTNEGDGFIYVDSSTSNYNVPDYGTRDIYYKDVFIVGFKAQFEPPVLSAYGENTNISLSSYGASSDNTNVINTKYVLYYSDGTVIENDGLSINLLTNKGNISKANKVKVKVGEATESHKYISTNIQAQIKINNPHERDIYNPIQTIEIPIKQYGYSVTEKIYNLTFTVNDIPSEGIEKLDIYTISEYITNIVYTQDRCNGETEIISSDNLIDAYLKISNFSYIDNTQGIIDNIRENKSGRRNVGMLQVEFEYNVHGLTNKITTTSMSLVYQL